RPARGHQGEEGRSGQARRRRIAGPAEEAEDGEGAQGVPGQAGEATEGAEQGGDRAGPEADRAHPGGAEEKGQGQGQLRQQRAGAAPQEGEEFRRRLLSVTGPGARSASEGSFFSLAGASGLLATGFLPSGAG